MSNFKNSTNIDIENVLGGIDYGVLTRAQITKFKSICSKDDAASITTLHNAIKAKETANGNLDMGELIDAMKQITINKGGSGKMKGGTPDIVIALIANSRLFNNLIKKAVMNAVEKSNNSARYFIAIKDILENIDIKNALVIGTGCYQSFVASMVGDSIAPIVNNIFLGVGTMGVGVGGISYLANDIYSGNLNTLQALVNVYYYAEMTQGGVDGAVQMQTLGSNTKAFIKALINNAPTAGRNIQGQIETQIKSMNNADKGRSEDADKIIKELLPTEEKEGAVGAADGAIHDAVEAAAGQIVAVEAAAEEEEQIAKIVEPERNTKRPERNTKRPREPEEEGLPKKPEEEGLPKKPTKEGGKSKTKKQNKKSSKSKKPNKSQKRKTKKRKHIKSQRKKANK
jgi:hypothetical protein